MKMTLEQYGAAIRAAYEAGYCEGTEHPTGQWGKMRAAQYSHAFWTRVVNGIAARRKSFAGEVAETTRAVADETMAVIEPVTVCANLYDEPGYHG